MEFCTEKAGGVAGGQWRNFIGHLTFQRVTNLIHRNKVKETYQGSEV